MGSGDWQVESFADRSHKLRSRPCVLAEAPLSILLRGGSTGQVLGSGIQQGDQTLPWSLVGSVLHGVASHHRHPGYGGTRLYRKSVGYAYQGERPYTRRAHQHGGQRDLSVRRAADRHREPRLYDSPVGPGRRQVQSYSDESQEERARPGVPSVPIHVRLGVAGQYQAVEVPRGKIHSEPVGSQCHSELSGGERRRGTGLWRRQRYHASLGLANRIQFPTAPGAGTTRLDGQRGWSVQHYIRHVRHSHDYDRSR